MDTILFICTGNTCRSSMAEGIFRKIVEEDEVLNNINIISAGTNVYFTSGATLEAINATKNMGIDISGHTSSKISNDLIDKADLILTMTVNHKNIVINMNDSAKGKVYTLKEFVGSNSHDMDVYDPYGMELEEYKRCANEIYHLLLLAKDKIREMRGR